MEAGGPEAGGRDVATEAEVGVMSQKPEQAVLLALETEEGARSQGHGHL